jgi:hypothetical protein
MASWPRDQHDLQIWPSEFVALVAQITPPVLLEHLGRTEVISSAAVEEH